jgi:hypothetical protein
MFDAQYVFKDTTVYSPWFEREGDYLIVFGELLQVNGGTSKLEVFMYSKSAMESGDGAVSVSPRLSISSVGSDDREYTDAQDLVRLRIRNPSTTSGDYILYRIIGMIWYDAVKA